MGFLVVVCGDFLVKVTENGGRRRRQVWLGLKEKGAGTSPGNSRESGALVLSGEGRGGKGRGGEKGNGEG